MKNIRDTAVAIGLTVIVAVGAFGWIGLIPYDCTPINWSEKPTGVEFVDIPAHACDWNIPLMGNLVYLKSQIDNNRKQIQWLTENYVELRTKPPGFGM